MANERRPRVAVIGGFYDLDVKEPQQGERARIYARELGEALANAGFGLVVYFSNDKSLEPHVVSGFVAAMPADEAEAAIDVRYSSAQQGEVEFAEQATRPRLFQKKYFAGPNWEAPFYRSLAARDSVDAVVLMAGGMSTLNAGQVAIGRGLPLLAIDRFSGSAKALFTELAGPQQDTYPSSHLSSPAELARWLRSRQSQEAEKLRQAQARQSDLESKVSQQSAEIERIAAERQAELESANDQRRGVVWTATAGVLMVATIGFGMMGAGDSHTFFGTMGIALLMSGAAGALARGLVATTLRLNPAFACTLGALAGLLVGLAYLIPQLIASPDLLNAPQSAVNAKDRIQFLSVVLVAFTAGIGFDVIFRRMLQEADSLPVKV